MVESPAPTPGNADVSENKEVAGKAIRKAMKTKGLQIDWLGGAIHKRLKTKGGRGSGWQVVSGRADTLGWGGRRVLRRDTVSRTLTKEYRTSCYLSSDKLKTVD